MIRLLPADEETSSSPRKGKDRVGPSVVYANHKKVTRQCFSTQVPFTFQYVDGKYVNYENNDSAKKHLVGLLESSAFPQILKGE